MGRQGLFSPKDDSKQAGYLLLLLNEEIFWHTFDFSNQQFLEPFGFNCFSRF
jgi:hypothetical protein